MEKLILLSGYGLNHGKWEIHLGRIEQTKNIISVIEDKEVAERIVKSYNKSLKEKV